MADHDSGTPCAGRTHLGLRTTSSRVGLQRGQHVSGLAQQATRAPVTATTARVAVTAHFIVYGIVLAVWVSRIPAIKAQAGLADGPLGIALLAIPAGVLLVTFAAGRLADRVGSAAVARVGGVAMPLVLITVALAHGLGTLMAALLAFGIASGALNVGMNANGVLLEQASGRRVMTSLHAGYSLGGLTGAVAGGFLAAAGVDPLATFAVTGLACAATAAVAGHWLLSGHIPGSRSAPGKDVPALGASAAELPAPGGAAARTARAGRRERLRRPGTMILLLGLTGLCALLAEGAAADWSAVYLRDNLHTSAGYAATGFAAFSVAMAVTRLLGDRLAARAGPAWVVRASGLVAAAGLAGGLISRQPAGAVAGFAVLGAGLACIAPQVFLAGGQADPVRPGRGLSQVVGISYLGMVGGPALIGLTASVTGLQLALGIPVLLALGVAMLAWVVALRAGRGTG
jgi:predicted MFS family arabinose efflux permease